LQSEEGSKRARKEEQKEKERERERERENSKAVRAVTDPTHPS